MKQKAFASLCVGSAKDTTTTAPHQLPLFATSSFVFDQAQDGIDIFTGQEQGHVYSRYANPTVDSVAQKIADLEGFDLDEPCFGIMTSSGMSAISTLMSGLLQAGDKVLTQGNLYGGTTELLIKVFGKLGIEVIFTDLADLDGVGRHLQADPSIRLIYAETPANPTLACIDLAAIAERAKAHDVLTAVDNTFCTPYLQRPLTYDIDYVIHSTTKYLNGHGNGIAGLIVGKQGAAERKAIWQAMKLLGTNCSPWEAWLVNNGLKTLPLRMDRHSQNAMELAQRLAGHTKVNFVNYCGLPDHPHHEVASWQMSQYGGMLSFEIAGGIADAVAFMDQLKLVTQAPTLGDVDTLVLHPATSSHLNVDAELRTANGITDGLIRLSVGIEDVEDLWADIEGSLG